MASRYFTIINLILITAFVGLSTGTFYKVLTTSLEDHTKKPAHAQARKKVKRDRPREKAYSFYQTVEKRNIFKASAEEEKKEPGETINLEEMQQTNLQLTLWGTVAGPGSFAWAIIEEKKTRKQALYKVGDVIQNATLTHVLRNKVVLNVNGKDQVLEVEESKGRKGAGRSTARTGSSARSGGTKKIEVERSLIDDSMKDLNKLMKDVRIRPHFKDGEADGLIISGIRGNSVFKKLGLRNGDIIMGVDGAKIESVDDAMKLYGGLKSMESMQVEIKRRGRIQTLDFDIK